MNYQPFYDMNILVSDPMLQALQDNAIFFIFIAFLTFYILVILHFYFAFLFVRLLTIAKIYINR